jgi:hypothetical protein
MKNIFKIAIFLSSLVLVLVIGNWAIAQQSGQGFFLEKGREFFIFDNLYINGYLTVGQDNLGKQGEFGDVLVQKRLILDEESSFVFCKDERQAQTNVALNRDCENKVLVWFSDPNKGLQVVDSNYTQLQTNKIQANKISLESVNRVYANRGVKVINGCFSNYDSNCNPNELETENLYLQTLGFFGTNKWVTLEADTLNLGDIDLGAASNFSDHKLCNPPLLNPPYPLPSDYCPKSTFKHPAFVDKDGRTFGFDVAKFRQGGALCCYLNVSF